MHFIPMTRLNSASNFLFCKNLALVNSDFTYVKVHRPPIFSLFPAKRPSFLILRFRKVSRQSAISNPMPSLTPPISRDRHLNLPRLLKGTPIPIFISHIHPKPNTLLPPNLAPLVFCPLHTHPLHPSSTPHPITFLLPGSFFQII